MLDNKEIWKDCRGYEGLYQVSNQGRVWSVRTQKCLSPQENSFGYLRVLLTAKNGKAKKELIHRLVGIAFIPNPENKPQINHKDSNPKNNNVENLEWNTAKENINQSDRLRKVSHKTRCVETGVVYQSVNDAARKLNLSSGHITEVCNGTRKTCGGFRWEVVT